MATILLIDDDVAGRTALKFRMEKAGHKVEESGDGLDGLARAQNLKPDIIFLDIIIPKLDGWQVCRAIKNDPKTKTVPVIMLTGCKQEIEELRGWECGADDYLIKPWTAEQIFALIEKFCSAKKAA